ncbi:ribonuclease H-like domain-containing protein [Rhizophagus clarus]|uniref:Ribonuclease H-like domain-containing protein n=1 Tax=Rhizophagus clarus TaxID=94130 RepID=A0A8H3LA87_9GLOM|nr:ribonuclease H-like domain-containing protein [Rhizophagus clarus]
MRNIYAIFLFIEYTLSVASIKVGCFVSNKAKLCRGHLIKCANFNNQVPESERIEILARNVLEDIKKVIKKQKFDKEKNADIIDKSDSESEKEEEEEETEENMVDLSRSTITTQSLITNYISRPLTKRDKPYFETLLLRMQVSNELPFTFFENQETKDVFTFIAPALKLPSRKKMSTKILSCATKILEQLITKRAQDDKIGVTVACDGWTNIKQEHLFGVVFITSMGETLIWGAKDISDERSKTENVINHIKNIMLEAEKEKIKINCLVSDSAGEYAAARRIMRVEYPNKVFLPCMAYQINLIVGEIFKESDIYQQTSIKAIKIVSYFHSSAYFTGLLRNEQKSLYGKTIALITPGETRWNSYYFCFHSILKTEAALKTLATKFAPERLEGPSTSRSGFQRQRHTSTTTKKFLSSDIISIINDSSFWSHLYELQSLILPLCAALNKLQKDMARLYEVVLAFGWVIKVFSDHSNEKFSENMITRLERRWNQWEQPLLLLSLVFHLQYRVSLFNKHFGQWVNYYYQVWFNKVPQRILREYLSYQREKYPFDMQTFNQLGGNIIDFWDLAKGDAPELSQFALHLYGICVNSASVEKLWSNMGFLHSKRRNRLDVSLQKKSHCHSYTPHETSSEDSEYSGIEEDDDMIQVSDEGEETYKQPIEEPSCFENENESDTIGSTEHWVRMLQNWMGMVREENIERSDSDETGPEFIAVDRTIHPADDSLAKWNLYSVFNNSLESPIFVNAMINLDSE